MPIGNPQGYRNTNAPMPGGGNVLSVMQQLEEEKKKKQQQGLMALLGLAALTGGNSELRSENSELKRGKSSPVQDGGVGVDLFASLARAGGDKGNSEFRSENSELKRGKSSPVQDAGVGVDLFASLARAGGDKGNSEFRRKNSEGGGGGVRRGGASGKSGAGAALGAAGSAAGFLSNPVVGAGIAGVTTLASGLLDGDGQEELQKDQLRASRQGDLFNGIRSMTDGIRRRNEELRSALHGYGR